MKRRNFILAFGAFVLMPKWLWAKNRIDTNQGGHNIIIKNGWVLKEGDV
jgi:hypothetical protein